MYFKAHRQKHTDKQVSEFLTPNKNRQRGREAKSFADKQEKKQRQTQTRQTNRKRLIPVVNCLHPNHNKQRSFERFVCLDPLSDVSQVGKCKRMMDEMERKEWALRESEIEK